MKLDYTDCAGTQSSHNRITGAGRSTEIRIRKPDMETVRVSGESERCDISRNSHNRPSPGLNPRRETMLRGWTTRISRRTFPFTVNLHTSGVCLQRRTYATQFRCGKEVIRKERKSFTHAQGIRRAFLQSHNNGYYTASVVLIPQTLCSHKILT